MNIIDTLVHIDIEANKKGILRKRYIELGKIISAISNGIIKDYGIYNYMSILQKVQNRLGHSLSPLDISLVQQLEKAGCHISNMTKCVEYAK